MSLLRICAALNDAIGVRVLSVQLLGCGNVRSAARAFACGLRSETVLLEKSAFAATTAGPGVDTVMLNMVREVSNIAAVDLDSSLAELLDSLGAVELVTRLKKVHGVEISPMQVLFETRTARGIARMTTEQRKSIALVQISAMHELSDRTPKPGALLLPSLAPDIFGDGVVVLRSAHSHSRGLALFVLHTPDGQCTIFQGLANTLVDEHHPVLGIEHGLLRSGDVSHLKEKALEDMADDYRKLILHVCITYNYDHVCLVGASFGAALAHSISHSDGGENFRNGLVLIDPPPPGFQALKTFCVSLSPLELRRIAAANLLVRSSIVVSKPMELAYAQTLFAPLRADEVDLMIAHHLAELGMAPPSMATVIDSKRRLDCLMHSQTAMVTSSWGSDNSTKMPTVDILVLAEERDTFFGEGPDATELGAFFQTTPDIVPGAHLSVMAACAQGKDQTFVAAVQGMLRNTG